MPPSAYQGSSPRVRGAWKPNPWMTTPQGSSPRVRGAALAGLRVLPAVGIIPARAGSRGRAPRTRRSTRDHPHVCGEQAPPRWRSRGSSGSSPRVRGAVVRRGRPAVHHGITPACEGSRPFRPTSIRACRDHPRACGEQWRRKLTTSAIEGSFPRVRGAGSKVLHNAHIIGIIPACAGSSCAHASTFLFGWDHPRACGEQFIDPSAATRT